MKSDDYFDLSSIKYLELTFPLVIIIISIEPLYFALLFDAIRSTLEVVTLSARLR